MSATEHRSTSIASRALLVLATLAVLLVLVPSCSKDTRHHNEADGGDADAATDTDGDTDSDTDTDSDSDDDAGTDAGPDSGTETGSWAWMDLIVDDDPVTYGGPLLGVGGATSQDVVVGGFLPQYCMLHFDGVGWSEIDFAGCGTIANIGTICESDVADSLWAAPRLISSNEWPIFLRLGGTWSTAPEPSWWDSSYETSIIDNNKSFTCLTGGSVAVIANNMSIGLGWLNVFDGSEWVIAHEFQHDLEGVPASVFGVSPDAIAVFTFPTGGFYFDGADVTPLSLPTSGDPDAIGGPVNDVAGDAVHGYYAVGYEAVELPTENLGFVWHSDDLQTWEEVEGVPHLDPMIYSDVFWGVDLDAAGNVYVVGSRSQATIPVGLLPGDHGGIVLRYDGTSWFEEDIPPLPDADPGMEWWTELYGVWCVDGNVFVVGGGYPGGMHPVVLQYSPP